METDQIQNDIFFFPCAINFFDFSFIAKVADGSSFVRFFFIISLVILNRNYLTLKAFLILKIVFSKAILE